VSNHTTEEIDLWNIDLKVPEKSGYTYDSQCPEVLKPEEACTIVVTWQPTTRAWRRAF